MTEQGKERKEGGRREEGGEESKAQNGAKLAQTYTSIRWQ
jgi:hypothetical protein